MPAEAQTFVTASVMAKNLGISDAKVKKAIKGLNIQPAAKKGCCSYYTQDVLDQIKASLK
jgi:hypothetical protein